MTTPDPALAHRLAQKSLRQEMDALRALSEELDGRFLACADLLCQCKGLIWVTGVGTSAAVGSRFAHILTDCGARSMFLSPSDGLHGHSAIMASDDLLVALSRGGESAEVTGMVEIARRRGVTTVAMVHDTASTLARLSDHVLPVRSEQSYELMGYVATTSTMAFCAMCDVLAAVALEAKGYTLAQLGEAHPGGAVGHALAGEAGR